MGLPNSSPPSQYDFRNSFGNIQLCSHAVLKHQPSLSFWTPGIVQIRPLPLGNLVSDHPNTVSNFKMYEAECNPLHFIFQIY